MSNRVVTAVLIVAAIFIFVADISVWAWMNVVDNDRFVVVARETMEREDVRIALATIIVDRMFENRPLLREAIGEEVAAALAGILGRDRFQSLFDRLADRMHRVIIAGGVDPVTLDITTVRSVVLALARVFRDEDDVSSIESYPNEIVILEEQRYAAIERLVIAIPWVAVFSSLAGIGLLALAFLRAADRSRALVLAGGTIAGVAVLTLVLSLPVRATLIQQFAMREQRIIVGELYDAFVRSLYAQTLILGAIGLIMVGIGLVRKKRIDIGFAR
jgi:hypothetical protein